MPAETHLASHALRESNRPPHSASPTDRTTRYVDCSAGLRSCQLFFPVSVCGEIPAIVRKLAPESTLNVSRDVEQGPTILLFFKPSGVMWPTGRERAPVGALGGSLAPAGSASKSPLKSQAKPLAFAVGGEAASQKPSSTRVKLSLP